MTITLNGSTGEVFPTWTTATRPSSPNQSQIGFNTTTVAFDMWNGSSWTSIPAPTSQGSSGQYLQSAGAGAAPTWATISASSGTLIRAPQIITSGTSYTTPSTCNHIFVQMIGGGGGGGTGNASGVGGGGGSGAYGEKYLTVSPSTSYTIAIGSAGASGSGGNNVPGGAGGSTSIIVSATTYTAGGGSGGNGASGSSGAGGAGGTATNCDFGISGMQGYAGASGAAGGNTVGPFFVNSGGALFNNSSLNASFYGGGGAGGGNGGGPFGNGYQGWMRIWEYT